MTTILTGLALTMIIFFGVPLAILRAGIRQQKRAGSLDCQPPGISAALARRVLGLHAHLAAPPARYASRTRPDGGEPALVPDNNRPTAP
jgi:hypothetical protein